MSTTLSTVTVTDVAGHATSPSPSTTSPDRGSRASSGTVPAHSTFAGVLRGEWIKLLSLRSTWWALASTAALMTLVSLAAAMSLDALATTPSWGRGSPRCTGRR